jgi:hypothetical protein
MTGAAGPLRRILLASIILHCACAVSSAAAKPEAPSFDPPLGSGKLVLSEDFEATPVGEIPKGFTKSGAVGVVDDVAHSGKKSLRMEAAEKGARRITVKGDVLKTLGGEHWGRLYFKVKLPAPEPQGTGKFPVIHSTLVAGSAQSPQFKDPIEVRVLDTVLGPKGSKSAAAAQLARAGPWTNSIDNLALRRQALIAFSTALFNLDDFDAGQKMLGQERDAAWRSDVLAGMAQMPREEQVASRSLSSAQASLSPAAPPTTQPFFGKNLEYDQVFKNQKQSQTSKD